MAAKVKLSEILNALEFQSDQSHAYVDRQTGEVVELTDEELGMAEDEEDMHLIPDWEKELVEKAKMVLEEEGERFVALPDRFEINEWDMMRDFAMSVEDEALSESLMRAIHGPGAFRYFKDKIHEAGIAEKWYAFREAAYRELAEEWCRDHGIEHDADS